MTVYCFDTSAFLDAWVRIYPPQNFNSLWDKIDDYIAEGKIISHEEVLRELEKKNDDVHKWAKKRSHVFAPIDTETQTAVSKILGQFQKLVGKGKFRGQADPFIIAYSLINNCVVVTAEKEKGRPSKPSIPLVCNHYKVKWTSVVDLIRTENWKF